MSESSAYKVAFIGTHGVGKTTLCYGLAAGLKARDVTPEVVREVARRFPLPINQDTNVASQSWILHTQIAEELVAQAHYGVVICDRSVLDNYVYMLVAAGVQRVKAPEHLAGPAVGGAEVVAVVLGEDQVRRDRRRPATEPGLVDLDHRLPGRHVQAVGVTVLQRVHADHHDR